MSDATAQNKVLSYPFEFEKSFLAKGDYDTYFLDNPSGQSFALVLKDNKKVEYVWLNDDFTIQDSLSSPIDSTALDRRTHKYIGGTAKNSEYHFIYFTKSGYVMETVDFAGKTVNHKNLLKLPGSEKLLASFSEYNEYYCVAADDNAGQLIVYTVDAAGAFSRKGIPFGIPADATKHKLSEYLAGLKVIRGEEEPELSSAVKSVKLFSRPDNLSIVVNEGDNPTRIFTISLPGLELSEKAFDYGSLVSQEEKGKAYISSYLFDNLLFSLILNTKDIRISLHDESTGKLLNKFEFTEASGTDLCAEYPITEKRKGKVVEGKEVDKIKQVIRAFTRGTEGLMVRKTDEGQLAVTVGTYDPIRVLFSGEPLYAAGALYAAGGFNPIDPTKGAVLNSYDPYCYAIPGIPSIVTTSARYYTTTYFKLLLDPSTLSVTGGRPRRSPADQIKDYLDDSGKRKATNQFAIGRSQYYGYYSAETQEYVIEQIRLF